MALRRASKALGAALALWAGAALAGPPERVVSINLCTDQLAMLLAAPGQLLSVSHISHDPNVSVMRDQALGYPVNHGQAEEVFAMAPDLVLAGQFTSSYTVGLLRRLGVEVAQLPIVTSLDQIPDAIRDMGRLLGREDHAEAVAEQFTADLAALRADPDRRPRAALHYANNYTSGDKSLANDILTAAGLANIALEAGLSGGGVLPMERLIMLMPDLIISGEAYPGASRSEAVLTHPALDALRDRHAGRAITDAEWVCGTPTVLRAIARLQGAAP
ncbi:ABC transporter substrate-binding protein [Roseibaca sp. Y0-43]|uniref:ABC transporter substrate-binding protein n=1 Tax=Roseibaca sp. Y0-43 TaxID=2816854 RepID=UPI001D0C0961|nr:ABC transporter substrate-binding protein [Roseibaca sp. Y0-43]MCC1480232.1 ABC transporter substrate-binding protein [Roseibaca sp. Y0-43]